MWTITIASQMLEYSCQTNVVEFSLCFPEQYHFPFEIEYSNFITYLFSHYLFNIPIIKQKNNTGHKRCY